MTTTPETLRDRGAAATCVKCRSYAINHHLHGRDGSDGDLCDVCYWRKRAAVPKLSPEARETIRFALDFSDPEHPADERFANARAELERLP